MFIVSVFSRGVQVNELDPFSVYPRFDLSFSEPTALAKEKFVGLSEKYSPDKFDFDVPCLFGESANYRCVTKKLARRLVAR